MLKLSIFRSNAYIVLNGSHLAYGLATAYLSKVACSLVTSKDAHIAINLPGATKRTSRPDLKMVDS